MEFGKNRVQYQNFFWTYYSYDRYEVYFSVGGKEIADYVAQSAKKNIADIEKIFDYPIDNKLQFIVYNKQSEFKQSNLGLVTDEQYNIGGVTRIVGSKVIIYFEGDHQKLEQQIRAGITEVLVNQMMYGGNLKDMLKNSTLLTLPDWYLQGLISYVASNWNADVDNFVKDGILSGRYTKFNRLTGADAVYAGHSIWKYIAETYGKSVVSNVLYMTKTTRNVESAFLFVLGISVKNLTSEWLESYRNKYNQAEGIFPGQPPVLKKSKARIVYSQPKLSPDGNYLIYATNELGQYKVWLYDLKKKKADRIIKKGYKLDRINDYSYPLLAWHPSGEMFVFVTEKKGKLFLTYYTVETKEKEEILLLNFDKILDLTYSDDGKKMVISAIKNGQSDIYISSGNLGSYEQITKDIYDDLNPRFVHNSKEIVFSSNRPDDTLRMTKANGRATALKSLSKDLFVYNYVGKATVLKRVTNTPFVNESNPSDYDSLHISYLSDANGIRNRYIASFDSVISYVDTSAHYRYLVNSFAITNYSRNILEQDINLKANKYAELIFSNGKYMIYTDDLKPVTALSPIILENTAYRDRQINDNSNTVMVDSASTGNSKVETIKVDEMPVLKQDSTYIDINNYIFEGERPKPSVPQEVPAEISKTVTDTSANTQEDFQFVKQKNYNINYATDYVVSQLDNSFLNASYQKFTGGKGAIYLNPGFTGFFKIGMSDLFEDYRIVAGMRLSGDLNSNEYFMSYEDRSKNLDKQLVLHRQALLNVSGAFSLIKVHTHEVKYVLKWPFSEVAGLRGTVNIRNDRTVFLATDVVNLQKPHLYQTWAGGKMEYVFDNTIKKGLNLYNGMRSKVFVEYFKQLDQKETDLIVTGFDVRHYQKIHRNIIWANRLAGSTSLGRQKLIYYMGGVDNWFAPKFDNSINIATDQNYAYQTLATNMRGFYQNIRNGNSFLVFNSELRFPIFKYFINRPIKSDFINNFQVIAFGDIGTAWTGDSPYDAANSLNKTIKGNPGNPLVITLNNQKEPIVEGYGFGLRSRLWGYFVRVDWAWGIEDAIVLPKLTYLSFSLDF